MIKKHQTIFIKILQNGSPVAQTLSDFGKKKTFALSASQKAELGLPFYPLSTDLPFLRAEKNSATLVLSEPWTGFLTSQKKPITLETAQHVEGREYQIFPGDFASLKRKDLHLLVKIGNTKTEKEIPHNPHYKGLFIHLFFKNKAEKISILTSFIIAAFLLGCLSLGLVYRQKDRPKLFEELSESYTLPFIEKKHLMTAPEALKEHFQRKDPITSVVRFYRYFVSLYLGLSYEGKEYLKETTKEKFQKENLIQKEHINEMKKQHKIKNIGSLSVPVIYGESFQEKTLRMLKKIDAYQKSLEFQLKDRQEISDLFTKDPDYDWTQYRDPGKNIFSQDISKIKVFNEDSNEIAMYKEAKALGDKAAQLSHIKGVKAKKLTQKNLFEIRISPKFGSGFFEEQSPKIFHEEIYPNILASQWDPLSKKEKKEKSIIEPLVGQIDIKELNRVMKEHRYQLHLCYGKALRSNIHLTGQMTWSWRIDTIGKIEQLSLDHSSPSVNDPRLILCVKEALLSWPYPKAKRGSVKITHDFLFENRSYLGE